MEKIYLDNAATTPITPEVKSYIISLLDNFYNPSSVYEGGISVKQIIEDARINVAKFINADQNESDILFTPSGSASNTLAIKGYTSKRSCNVLYSPIAHKSILECVKSYNKSYPLTVDNNGVIDIRDLREWLDSKMQKPFVVIDYANSEIGTIQDVKAIIDMVHFYNGIVYLDCTGSIPSFPIDVQKLDVDMLGFSAHKLSALKGCGVLYKKKNIELEPIVYGNQEQGLIGGTENILGIAALGKTVENYDYSSITSKKRYYIYNKLIQSISDCYLVGSIKNRLPHNLYMIFKGVEGESLMLLLDSQGICVSTGSACSSANLTPSVTLSTIGIPKEDVHSGIRITISGNETYKELDYVCEKIKQNVDLLRSLN